MKNTDYEIPAYHARLRPTIDAKTHLLLDCFVIVVVMVGLFALSGEAPPQADPCRSYRVTESSARYLSDRVTIGRQSMWNSRSEAFAASDAIQS